MYETKSIVTTFSISGGKGNRFGRYYDLFCVRMLEIAIFYVECSLFTRSFSK